VAEFFAGLSVGLVLLVAAALYATHSRRSEDDLNERVYTILEDGFSVSSSDGWTITADDDIDGNTEVTSNYGVSRSFDDFGDAMEVFMLGEFDDGDTTLSCHP
jgi:hypothetical protein